MVRCAEDRLGELGDCIKGRFQVDILKRAGPHHLGLHLTGQRQYRRAVNLGIPETCDQVGRSGAGNRQAGGRLAREFAIAGTRKRCSALVTNADISHLAIGCAPAQGVREAEVRVPDHAEDRFDVPVHQRLGHNVCRRALVFGFCLQPDENLAVADINGKEFLTGVFVSTRRSPCQRIEVPTMPWTADPARTLDTLFDGTFAKGAALMRTAVVHGRPLAVKMDQTDGLGPGSDGLDPAFRQIVNMTNFDPVSDGGFGFGRVVHGITL